jgi:hypothetical protein
MTRRAAKDGVERFLQETIDLTREEFRVRRVLQGSGLGPGGIVVDRLRENAQALERRLIEPKLTEYRTRSLAQFDVLLEYIDDNAPIRAFEEPLLTHDTYLHALDPSASSDTRETLIDASLERLQRLGDGLAPVVYSSSDEFWPAAESELSRQEASDLIENGFPFSGPLRRHRDAVTFEISVDPGDILGGLLAGGLPSVSIEYTDEALRAMRQAERTISQRMRDEVDSRFV